MNLRYQTGENHLDARNNGKCEVQTKTAQVQKGSLFSLSKVTPKSSGQRHAAVPNKHSQRRSSCELGLNESPSKHSK